MSSFFGIRGTLDDEARLVLNDTNFHIEVRRAIKRLGIQADLNYMDVSKVTNMERIFEGSSFIGNISQWDVSNVQNMCGMFAFSWFNGDVSGWNTSSVEDMSGVFYESEFNGDISQWNVSNAKDMRVMFDDSKFNGDISPWTIKNECKVSSNDTLLHHTKIGKIHFMERANNYWRNCTWPEWYQDAFDRFMKPIMGLYPNATPSEKGALAWIAYQDSLLPESHDSIDLPDISVD